MHTAVTRRCSVASRRLARLRSADVPQHVTLVLLRQGSWSTYNQWRLRSLADVFEKRIKDEDANMKQRLRHRMLISGMRHGKSFVGDSDSKVVDLQLLKWQRDQLGLIDDENLQTLREFKYDPSWDDDVDLFDDEDELETPPVPADFQQVIQAQLKAEEDAKALGQRDPDVTSFLLDNWDEPAAPPALAGRISEEAKRRAEELARDLVTEFKQVKVWPEDVKPHELGYLPAHLVMFKLRSLPLVQKAPKRVEDSVTYSLKFVHYYQPWLMDNYTRFIRRLSKELSTIECNKTHRKVLDNALISANPIHLPMKIRKWTVNRGPFIDSKSKDQFEIRYYTLITQIRLQGVQSRVFLQKFESFLWELLAMENLWSVKIDKKEFGKTF